VLSFVTQGTFKSVTGTFTVPTPTVRKGASPAPAYTATAWVGIDGDTCGSAILQAGVGFVVSNTFAVSYCSISTFCSVPRQPVTDMFGCDSVRSACQYPGKQDKPVRDHRCVVADCDGLQQ
jgi:hypothetical protein